MIRIAALIALMVPIAAFSEETQWFKPKNSVVLSGVEAKKALRQCSRDSPQDVTGMWTPTTEQVHELEARLPNALAHALDKRVLDNIRTYDIARQYSGIVIGTRKIVYVNAFELNLFNEEKRAFPNNSPSDWKHKAVNVCDGGAVFFGVEYDPKTRTFVNFAFNGGG